MGDLGLIPGLERSPGEGNSNSLQSSGLVKPHGQSSLPDYSQWGHKESDMTERLHFHFHKLRIYKAKVIKCGIGKG